MANRLQKEQSQVSQFAGKNRKKGIGDMIAAQIETAYGLQPGWMDQPHINLWESVGFEFTKLQKSMLLFKGGMKIGQDLVVSVNDALNDNTQQPNKTKVSERPAEYMVPLSAWDDETPLDDDEVARPCFTEVEASAGAGKTVVQENHGPKIRFSRRTLRKCGVLEENAYGIKVSGNSMMPVLPHGATIGVDVGKKTIVDGEMYAVDHDGMLRVKMLYRVPGNQVRLASFNREEYKDETVSMNEVKVIGRVFWYSVLR